MNWSAVSVLARPTFYPVTLAEAKAACRVTHADQDAQILGYVAQAVAEIDGPNGEGIAMCQQTWRLQMDRFPPGAITLPGWPITAVAGFNYRDPTGTPQLLSAANYRVDIWSEPYRIEADAWPSTDSNIGAVWIDYTLGAASASDIPEDLRGAVLARVQQFYDAETYGPLDQFIQRTLGRYRRGFVAA